MMNETLFRETFSQLHASDEAKREVLSMIETRQNRQTRRIGRVVGLAAALTGSSGSYRRSRKSLHRWGAVSHIQRDLE